MNKVVKRTITVILLLVAVLALAWPKLKDAASSSSEPSFASSASNALQVEGVVIAPVTLYDRIFTTGTIRANEEVELRSEAAGKITGLYFQEGRPVAKGDLMVKINDSELQAQIRKAEFRVMLAEDREQRQQQLLEKGGISREEYEATLNELNVLRSDIELIKAQLEKTEVRAPFDGIVGLRHVSVGSYITTTTVITTIQDVDPVKIDFSIPERYAQRIGNGDVIFFNLEGLEDTFEGTVYASETRIDANTRTLQVRALSSNESGRLVPGAFANIDLIFSEIPDALAVPSIAIIPELGGKKVYLHRNGKAMSTSVETGIRTEENVQVTEGLTPGDTVIISGVQLLRPGIDVVTHLSE